MGGNGPHIASDGAEDRTVDPASFYSSRPGSHHTTYVPPAPDNRVTRRASSSPAPQGHIRSRANSSGSDIPALVPVTADGDHWPPQLAANVPIDGRDADEERDWWNPAMRESKQRPGPGLLPSAVVRALLAPGEPSYSLSFTAPRLQENAPSATPSSPASPSTGSPSTTYSPPTESDINLTKPHPHASYFPTRNSWIVADPNYGPLPDLRVTGTRPLPCAERRERVRSCADTRTSNATHHLHRYESALHISSLQPPLTRDAWLADSDLASENVDYLDVYACCQCSFYLSLSKPIHGVIAIDTLGKLIEDRLENPTLGMNGPGSVLSAFEILLKAVENNAWKGESRALSVTGKAFQKLGSNKIAVQLFHELNYDTREANIGQAAVNPPKLEGSNPEAHRNRARLLRAWLETRAFLHHFHGKYASDLNHHKQQLRWVFIQETSGDLVKSLDAESQTISNFDSGIAMTEWKELGLHSSHISADIIEFAYRAQCRCNPARTPFYLTCVKRISESLPADRSLRTSLEALVALEYSRDRWTEDHIAQAAESLGFGGENDLKVDWCDEVDDGFAISAWKDAMRQTWTEIEDKGRRRRKELSASLRILGEQRGSSTIMAAIRDSIYDMDPEQAYRVLEVPKEVEESMLMMVYQMRVEDQPHQLDRMRQAMDVIAEYTNSHRLRQFLITGMDSGDQPVHRPFNWPRGLNQLGNTCYLNSLLQYFFTISELRSAVTSLTSAKNTAIKAEELSRFRVGGRIVSQREVERSRLFVSQLANLFAALERSEEISVTPTMELAKLALVTSKDEDEDHGGTNSSGSTDATLVEDPLHPSSYSHDQKDSYSPVSILGKRVRENQPLNAGHGEHDAEVQDMQDSQGSAGQPEQTNPPPLPPRKRPDANDESTMLFGKQHDVAECMDNCLFQIEAALLPVKDCDGENYEKTSIVKSLFYGKLRQRLSPMESHKAGSVHAKDDAFSHLPVNVTEDALDLYDGLGRYFEDIVEFNGSRTRMNVAILELPPLLQIQLQRVQFDRARGQAFKCQAYLKYGETLYMDRFMEDGDPTIRARSAQLYSEISSCRESMRHLTESNHRQWGTQLAAASSFLMQRNPSSLGSVLNDENRRLSAHLKQLDEQMSNCKAEVDTLWADCKQMEYELTSVFIHRGASPSWGHYFFYARDLPEKPDSWFKMNDNEVSLVSKDEVLADTTDSNANAYLLVYAKKGSGVIQTVQRGR